MATRRKPTYAIELTPDWANDRWKKVYRGRQLYFAFPINREGYRRAMEEWLERKAELDGEAERDKPYRDDYEAALSMRESIAEYCSRELQADPHDCLNRSQADQLAEELQSMHDKMQAEVTRLKSDFSRIQPKPLDQNGSLPIFPLKGLPIDEILHWQGRLETLRNFRRWQDEDVVKVGESIGDQVNRYLQERERDVAAEQLKATSFRRLRQRLSSFGQFAGNERAASLSAQTLSRFRDDLLKKVSDGDYAPSNAKYTLNNVKTFVTWLWEQEVLEQLPRNFRRLSIKAPDREIRVFTLAEVRIVMEAASDRSKLFMLLMMNCGFTQIDISELGQDNVNWPEGRIIWKRAKERNEENVPTVNFLLWDEALRLLAEHRSDDPQRVLLNENGRPLRRTDTEKEDADNIRLALARTFGRKDVRDKIENKQPKLFRKTSASILETHDVYGRYAQFFLGHSAKTVAERHYVKPSQEKFDNAVKWLGEQYGFLTSPRGG